MQRATWGWAVLALFWGASASAQTWKYYSLNTDVQESGRFPHLVADTSGNLHACYWNARTDRLVYGHRPAGSTAWAWELVEPNAPGGYIARLSLDDAQQPCLAWHANVGGSAQVRYAQRSGSGTWSIENATIGSIGRYGPASMTGVGRLHAGIDLRREGPDVYIVYFRMEFTDCDNTSIVLEPYLARKTLGAWTDETYGNYVVRNYLNSTTLTGINDRCCETKLFGDRYGEFPNLLKAPDGRFRMLCTSKGSGLVLSHREILDSDPPLFWFPSILDTAWKHVGTKEDGRRCTWTYEGLSATYTPDGKLHTAVALSDNYGVNAATTFSGKSLLLLVYSRYNAAGSLEHQQYIGPGPTDLSNQQYRAFTSLAAKDSLNLAFAYVNFETGAYELAQSTDGGTTWSTETVASLSSGRDAPSLVWANDSLYVLTYDDQQESLHLASRSDTAGPWTLQRLTSTHQTGTELAAHWPQGTETLHLLHINQPLQRLEYATADSTGLLSTDSVNSGGFNNLNVVPAGGDIHVVYSSPAQTRMLYQRKASGLWTAPLILDAGTSGDYLRLLASPSGDSLHLFYYDPAQNRVFYRWRSNGTWQPPVAALSLSTPTVCHGLDAEVASDNKLWLAIHTYTPSTTADDTVHMLVLEGLVPTAGLWARDTADLQTGLQSSLGPSLSLNPGPSIGVAYLQYDDQNDSVLVWLQRSPGGPWQRFAQQSLINRAETLPLVAQQDSLNRPWALLQRIGLPNEPVILHYGVQQPETWASLYSDNNLQQGQVGGNLHFWLRGKRIRVLGVKQKPGDPGMALLELPDWTQTVLSQPQPLEAATGPLQAVLYPNPVQHQAWLQIVAPDGQPVELQVLGTDGRLLWQQTFSAAQAAPPLPLPVQQWPTGCLLLSLECGNHKTWLRLVHLP